MAHGDQRPGDGTGASEEGLWTCVEKTGGPILQPVESGWTGGTNRFSGAETGAAVRLGGAAAHPQTQGEPVDHDAERAVRDARRRRVGAQQLELRHVPGGNRQPLGCSCQSWRRPRRAERPRATSVWADRPGATSQSRAAIWVVAGSRRDLQPGVDLGAPSSVKPLPAPAAASRRRCRAPSRPRSARSRRRRRRRGRWPRRWAGRRRWSERSAAGRCSAAPGRGRAR